MLAALLSGCGLIKVSGGRAEAEASPAPTQVPTEDATPAASEPSKQNAPAASAASKQKSKAELQCESSFMGALQHRGAIERTGELHVSTANDGFSAEALKAAVSSCYKGYGETPSAEALARADEAMKEQREAALVAAKKWQLPEAAAADPKAEQAIKKDFLAKHAGSDIKRVFMTSGWKTNTDGLVVRNRYKEAIVLIGVKGTDICMRVKANAAQASNGSGFDSKYSHDVFNSGTVVQCQ
jgi:hypothetical protein